jgi:glycyl-tRNA synthetase alpha chain
MYVQGVDRVFDLNFNGRADAKKLTYGDVFLQAEQEYSRYNFEHADIEMLLAHFKDAEAECKALLEKGWSEAGLPSVAVDARGGRLPAGESPRAKHKLALPAYDQCIKASHVFNLLDARGVISVTERQSYILRVRELAKACCGAWLATEGGGAG